jgi:hypothetical protein
MIFEIIIPIAMFDIFESDEFDVLSMVFPFDTDAQEVIVEEHMRE